MSVPPETSRRDSETIAGGKRSATTGMRPRGAAILKGSKSLPATFGPPNAVIPSGSKPYQGRLPVVALRLPPAIVLKPLRGVRFLTKPATSMQFLCGRSLQTSPLEVGMLASNRKFFKPIASKVHAVVSISQSRRSWGSTIMLLVGMLPMSLNFCVMARA